MHGRARLRDQLKKHFAQSNSRVWVAAQNRFFDSNDEPDHYYVGRATGVKEWEENGTNGRVIHVYDAGDLEIDVEWFCRDISGGDERRVFKKWIGEPGKNYSFNSTELRAINLEMQFLAPVGSAA